jgi:hypothetical protein
MEALSEGELIGNILIKTFKALQRFEVHAITALMLRVKDIDVPRIESHELADEHLDINRY